MIYFDNAATTFPKPEQVYKKMDNFYRKHGVNAGRGSYKKAKLAAELKENTKKKLAKVLGIKNNKSIIFTSSATHAINLVLQGQNWNSNDVVYYSPFEHNAILRTLYYLEEKHNIILKKIPVDFKTQEFKLDKLKKQFVVSNPSMVIVTQVSNVTGNIAPVNEIAKLTSDYDAQILVDGAQGAGLLPIDLDGIDYYIWAGHKTLYGPFGIGGVIIDSNSYRPYPLIYGGTGQFSRKREMPTEIPIKYEAGSNNILSIAGLNASLNWIIETGISKINDHEIKLKNRLIEIFKDFMEIYLYLPRNEDNHVSIISANFAEYKPYEVGEILDNKFDIAVRTGIHCAPEAHRLLGTDPHGTVRFSLSYFNKMSELDSLNKKLDEFII